MNQQPESPIDLAQLNQISEGDIEFEVEVLQIYVEDTLRKIAEIRQMVASKDRDQIMREAHYIKGSSSNVGASHMLSLAIQIEDLALGQDLKKVLEVLDNMVLTMQAVESFTSQKAATLSA